MTTAFETKSAALMDKRLSKAQRAQTAMADLLSEVARGGYFGAATLTLSIQDGHVQQIKVATERIVK